ncbi:MAG TPA: hypothetical protein G4O00_10225 [Thermoflexia bacterium]|nr:hypothetical protein [Thermoflexia bacterium]
MRPSPHGFHPAGVEATWPRRWAAAVALAGFLLTATTVIAQTDWPNWPAPQPVNFSNSSIDEARRPVITAGPSGQLLAAWRDQSGLGEQGWLYARVTSDSGDTWSSTETITTTTEEILPPDALIVEDQFFVTWAQRRTSDQNVLYVAERGGDWSICRVPGPNSTVPVRPRFATTDGRLHLVFSANQGGSTIADLYHTSRPLTATGCTEWPTATVFFTHTALYGSYFPSVASGPDGRTLHVVWEERHPFQVWAILYMSGTVTTGGTVVWNSPITLSEGITYSVNPDIAADATGDLHVVWGEVVGKGQDQRQYVRYVRYDAAEGRWLFPSVRIADAAVQVNYIEPASTFPHVSVFGGSPVQVCVVWPGYPVGASPTEEIWISCSTDGGTSWSTPANVSRSPDDVSIRPWSAFDGQGRLHVVWEERQLVGETSHYEIYYTRGFNRFVFLPLVLRGWP